MRYDLDKDLDRQSFKVRVNSLYERRVTVELVEKTRKTLQQTRYVYLIMGWFSLQTGISLEVVKREIFKKRCNPDIFLNTVHSDWGDFEDIVSIRDVSKENLSTAIDRFRNFSSSEVGIYLPSSDERDYLDEIEYEVSRNQRWIY